MIILLRKIFIKNYKDVANPKVRTAHGKVAAFFGLISNLILFVLKLIFGLLASSVSIIAESADNLSDFASSTITLIGFKMASKPADKKHPFGHQRIEYVSGLIVSIVVLVLAVLFLYESIMKIVDNSEVNYSIWTIIILGIAIIVKLVQAYVNYAFSKIIKSVSLKATALDSLLDTIKTTLLFIGALLSYLNGWNIDGYMGIAISIFVIISGIKMIADTSSPLIGEYTKFEDIKKITDIILSYEGVLGIHDVVAHNYGPTKIFMTVHVEVDAKENVLKSHSLIDRIENDIKNQFNVELTIHMDPIDTSNPETIALKKKASDILKNISSELSLHDFRVVHGETSNNIIFDVVVPFDFKIKEEDIRNILAEKMNESDSKKENLIIHFDHPFVEK